jgi:uncharacterized membrane protein required for colicin V production
MAWPDLVIALALGLGVLGGWWRGLIGEVIGLLSMLVSAAAGFLYQGWFDKAMMERMHVGPGPAHAFGMAAFGAVAYAAVFALGIVLRGVTWFPVIRTFNIWGGAIFGGLKTLLFLWVALYVALFFPLPHDIRAALHQSVGVAALELPNHAIDGRLRDMLPPIVRPYAGSIFGGHHV